ncbi:MAG: peptidase T [Chitinophagaceae bacterium]|nr:peptidase T [Chitinophagaceae bacterium]
MSHLCAMNDFHSPVAGRFMKYVTIDTQSDPHSPAQPSTEKQKDLSRILVAELLDMGVTDAELDEAGYVYATIPSTVAHPVPVVCFCAHVDTAPDCSGTGVKPQLHRKWDGSPIVLPDDPTQVLTTERHPYLAERIGDDIITASGTTLLGADDKAGVAIIMEAAARWMADPSIPHGNIRLLFTPDEEIGRGVDKVDMQRLGAVAGYTLDGSERGSLEDETFSADGLDVVIQGISAHPGFAKGRLVNALKVAAAFIEALPKTGLSPETTTGREGFVHPVHMQGTAESATVSFILRDFRTARLDEYEALIRHLLDEVMTRYPGAVYQIRRTEQYRNMKEVLDQHPEVVTKAEDAIRRAGMTVLKHPVRGGTDGSRLSFMGLPCPNIFTGEMAFHSLQEYVSVQDMEKAVETILHLATIWTESDK